jgi:hypothetical protein
MAKAKSRCEGCGKRIWWWQTRVSTYTSGLWHTLCWWSDAV